MVPVSECPSPRRSVAGVLNTVAASEARRAVGMGTAPGLQIPFRHTVIGHVHSST